MYDKNGIVWIHEKCFFEITEMVSDIKKVKKILEGKLEKWEHPDTVVSFLKRMDDFRRRWEGSMRLIGKLKGKKHLGGIEVKGTVKR